MKSLDLVESIDVFERRSEFDSLVYVARIVIDGRVFETFEHVEKESSLFELFEIVENNVEDVEEIEKYFDMIEEFIAKESFHSTMFFLNMKLNLNHRIVNRVSIQQCSS